MENETSKLIFNYGENLIGVFIRCAIFVSFIFINLLFIEFALDRDEKLRKYFKRIKSGKD